MPTIKGSVAPPGRPYATEEELKNLGKVHVPSIVFMKKFLEELPSLEHRRALDVAGADGRVIKALLHDEFAAVDLFDQDQKALEKMERVRAELPRLKHADQATMQTYVFKEKYNLILLCWCAGYPADHELLAFLSKARQHLIPGIKQTRRKRGPASFIVVLDNVDDAGKGTRRKYGQRIRKESQLKSIFSGAGLTIWKESQPK